MPFIWPVFAPCPAFNLAQCLTFKLHIDRNSIVNMLEGASFSAETIDLRVQEHVLIDGTSQIKVGEKLELQIGGHAVILGRVTGGKQAWQVSGNFINMGEIKTASDLVIKALNIALTGITKSDADLTITAVNNAVLSSLYYMGEFSSYGSHMVSQYITQESSTSASGKLLINSGKDIQIIGAYVLGDDVHLKATNGKVIIVPIKLYNEVSHWGSTFYYSYQSLQLQRPSITSRSKDVQIEAGDGILLSAINFQSAGNGKILTSNNVIIDSPEEYIKIVAWQQEDKDDLTGFLFGGTETTSSINVQSTPIQSILNLLGSLWVKSDKDQHWIGANVKAYSVKLEAGSPEKAAMIALLPAYKSSYIYVETKTTGFELRVDSDGIGAIFSSTSKNSESIIEVIPTIFKVKDQFMGYCKDGKWRQLSATITSDGSIHLDAKTIELAAAPDIKVSYASLDETGFGVGFSDKSGEFAVQAMLWQEKQSSSTTEITHKQRSSMTANFIQLEAENYSDAGVIYNAAKMKLNAKIIFHGVLKDSLTKSEQYQLIEAGVKLGIKSNLGQMYQNCETIAEADYSRPEGSVNAGFAASELYDNILRSLSPKANHGLSGGIWFYGQYTQSSSSSSQYTAIPTIIQVSEMLKSESEELIMIGTQINAYNLYIKTKYFKAAAAEHEYSGNSQSQTYEVEIPIEGTVAPSFNVAIAKGNSYQRLAMNVNIYVAGHLQLEVNGHADLRGVFLSANSLDAFFESLILESVQDIVDNHSWGQSIGASLDNLKTKNLDSLSGAFNDNRHQSHVVARISAILGKEHAHIVVANALNLNAAMIASAQRNPDGSFTDHGNLVLKVGEFFIQHIYDYDEGHTLGASANIAISKKERTVKPTVGAFKKEGTTSATVGSGKIETASTIPAGLNRDVKTAQTMHTEYDVDPITGYVSNPNREALKEDILKDKNGKFDLKATTESMFKTAKSFFFTQESSKTENQKREEPETSEASKAESSSDSEVKVKPMAQEAQGSDDSGKNDDKAKEETTGQSQPANDNEELAKWMEQDRAAQDAEESTKSPEVKAREELERKTLNNEAIKTNMYLLKKYLKEEDQKKAYIKSALIDYIVAKSQGVLTKEAIGALGVLGILELPQAAGLATIYGIATFGDDEKEFYNKIKAKGNYKK